MVIKDDDVVGYVVDNEDVCEEYCSKEEIEAASADDFILAYEIEKLNNNGERRFCDRCKEEF